MSGEFAGMSERRWLFAGGQEEQDCDWKSSMTVRSDPWSGLRELALSLGVERGWLLRDLGVEAMLLSLRKGFIVLRAIACIESLELETLS